jgi:hypothetical protein
VGYQLGQLGPLDRSAGLLVGRTNSSGTVVSLVGGNTRVPMSHSRRRGERGPKAVVLAESLGGERGTKSGSFLFSVQDYTRKLKSLKLESQKQLFF